MLRCSKVTITGALSGTEIASVELLVPHFCFAHMCCMTLAVCVNNHDIMGTLIEGATNDLLCLSFFLEKMVRAPLECKLTH